MKKRKNLLPAIAAVLFAALLFTGCQQLMGSGATVQSNSNSETRSVKLAVTNYDDYVTSSETNGRAINPTMWDENDLVFYLYGTPGDGSTSFAGKSITLNGDGTAALEIANKNWDLTLIGVKTGDPAPAAAAITSTAYVIGRAHVDLSRWAQKANFTLTTDGLTTPGDVSMSVKLPQEIKASEWTFTGGIYDRSGTAIKTAKTLDFAGATEAADKSRTVTYAETGLTPGYYYFTVNLSKTSGVNDDAMSVAYSWSQVIHVIPGAATYPAQTIPDDLIGSNPTKPASATVTYKTDTAKDGQYQVTVGWTDSADTEQFYEFEVAELAAKTVVPTDSTSWGTPSASTVYSGRTIKLADGTVVSVDLLTAPNYVSGSVLQNNITADIKLETGKFYGVRVRAACTDGRASDWTYATISGFDTNNKYLNRYNITYNKNGGSGTLGTTAGGVSLVAAYTYSDTVTLADGSTLTLGPNTFKEWQNATGTKVTAADAQWYSDQFLYAIYSAKATWTIFDPKDRDFTTAMLSFTYAGSSLTAPYSVQKSGTNVLAVTVTESATDWDYEKLWLVVNGVEQPSITCSGNQNTVSYDCSSFAPGYTYQILICGSTRKGTVVVSSNLNLKVTD